MDIKNISYVVVTPVRDEEEYLPLTFQSILQQTIRPKEWVIVNDGSKDGTGRLMDEYAAQYPWIKAVHRKDRGHRKWGAGIIEAFYDGFNALTVKDWDFMCKLDGDLSFQPGYFEGTFKKFAENSKLGIGGGFLYHVDESGVKAIEDHPVFHVRGGAKIYRRKCWDQLEGLWVGPGSDTVDEVKANMLGWKTMSFMDLQMHHHRYTGAAYGKWGAFVKGGKCDYVVGYHPLFLLAKCAKRLFQRPYMLGSAGILWGYVKGYLEKTEQVDDPRVINYLREQQMARLLGRETVWK